MAYQNADETLAVYGMISSALIGIIALMFAYAIAKYFFGAWIDAWWSLREAKQKIRAENWKRENLEKWKRETLLSDEARASTLLRAYPYETPARKP